MPHTTSKHDKKMTIKFQYLLKMGVHEETKISIYGKTVLAKVS